MINMCSEIKKQALAFCSEIESIDEGSKVDKFARVVKSVNDYLLEMARPHEFQAGNEDNILVQMDLSFQELCSSLEDNGVFQPAKLSVFELNSRIAYYDKKNRAKSKKV